MSLGGGGGGGGGGSRGGNRVGEHESTIITVGGVVVVIFVVGGAEIDARATLQGSEESRSHVSADPVGHSVELVAGHDGATTVAVVAVAVVGGVVFHLRFFFTVNCAEKRGNEEEREENWDESVAFFFLATEIQSPFLNPFAEFGAYFITVNRLLLGL